MNEKVFNLFFGLLLARLEREGKALSFKMELFEETMKSSDYSREIKKIFRESAINAKAVLMANNITQTEMRSAIDTAYGVLCEQFGPVEADDVMGGVIAEMEGHPESRSFPVREYL